MHKVEFQSVFDRELGEVFFPVNDVVMSSEIRKFGIWEKNECNWLKRNIVPGDICLNVGANVGYFSILMAELTGKSGFVHAFEPNPEVVRCFKKNISLRGIQNIQLREIAVGNKNGLKTLYLNKRNYGDSRTFNPMKTNVGGDYVVQGFEKKIQKRIVPIRKLDSIVQSRVDVVLIDTQGSDHLVIRGMSKIIKKHSPKILTEFVPGWINDLGEDPISVLEEYASYGYEIGSDDLPLSEHPEPMEIISKIESSGTFFANLSLIPLTNKW
jgi:FkbM family methyltransferase